MTHRNPWLLAAAGANALAALLHLACIAFGAQWYRAMGAGEAMAQMAERGDWTPAVAAAGIACVLSTWSLYALSGAGAIRRLPLLRPALWAITGVYLLRGGVGLLIAPTDRRQRGLLVVEFDHLSAIGALHFTGMRIRRD